MTPRGGPARDSWGRFLTACLGVLVATLLTRTPLLESWERRSQDGRLLLRGSRPTRARIVLAEIRPSTVQAWQSLPQVRWGPCLAAAIEAARAAGAGWIGLDLIVAHSGGEAADRPLVRALARGRVALAAARSTGGGPILPIDALLFAHPEQSQNLGFIDVRPEVDEVVRRAVLFQNVGDQLLPSLPALLALRSRGRSPLDQEALRQLAGSRTGDGSVWINYVGPPGAFPSVPLERLALGRLTPAERGRLRDAVVLIGPAEAGANDLHRGPAGWYYYGMEIHAHVLATLLDGRALRRLSPSREALLTAVVGAAVAAPLAALPFGWGIVWAVAAAAGWWGASARAFGADLLWPNAGPLLAIGLAWIGNTGALGVTEARHRRQVETMFGQHVSAAVVKRLLRDPVAAALGGERREMTILFSDIRDFTPRSEQMSPEAVVAQLNEYLGAMAESVFRHGGTLDKYIGDAVMAFWNSPLE